MDAADVLVTGGTGLLGRRVVDRLRAAGRDARVLSRSGRPVTVRGDLRTGNGLDRAVNGVTTIVHCASNPSYRKVDVEGTGRLLRAASRAGVAHIVYISIVGVDRNPFPYYRAKLDTERVVERSPVPWTILRATQFHDLVLKAIRALERLPIAVAPKGFLLQLIDAGEVADRLAELALADPAGRAPDVGGPQVWGAKDLISAYFEATGRRRAVLEVPLPGGAARAFREGAQVAPGPAWGSITWEEFLRTRLSLAEA